MKKLATLLTAAILTSLLAQADELKIFKLTTKNGTFAPLVLEVPANEKFKLLITNEGSEAEEFESYELNREKVVEPGQTITVYLGPLSPGEYGYFGDFHRDTAKGTILAK